MIRLCRRMPWQLPAGKDEHSRVALQRTGEHLRALNAKTDTIVLDCRNGGLWDPRELRQSILAQLLELADDSY